MRILSAIGYRVRSKHKKMTKIFFVSYIEYFCINDMFSISTP